MNKGNYNTSINSFAAGVTTISVLFLNFFFFYNSLYIAWSNTKSALRCTPVPLFTKMMPSYGYRNPHYKPKKVWHPSQLYNGNPYSNSPISQSGEQLEHHKLAQEL